MVAVGVMVSDAGAVVPERAKVAQFAVPLHVGAPNARPERVAPPPLETVIAVEDEGGAPAKVVSDTAAFDRAMLGPGPTVSFTATLLGATAGSDDETATVA